MEMGMEIQQVTQQVTLPEMGWFHHHPFPLYRSLPRRQTS
jgi:trehalose-6-phosphate synthase